jgi:hypothetical protein
MGPDHQYVPYNRATTFNRFDAGLGGAYIFTTNYPRAAAIGPVAAAYPRVRPACPRHVMPLRPGVHPWPMLSTLQ